MEKFAIILAGGVGYNFWPRSREKRPKHLLKFFDNKSLLQLTLERISDIFPKENVYIITNRLQKMAIKEQLPEIPVENIIDEPFAKKTAASIALANAIIEKRAGEAVTTVLPCDHVINDNENYKKALLESLEYAEHHYGLVTIGIKPTFPAVDYGYIQFDETEVSNLHKVLTFAEKPTEGTAERFVESGDFLWNSGIFTWRTGVIKNEIKTHMTDLYHASDEIFEVVGEPEFDTVLTSVYSRLKSTSIDYGILESSEHVFVVEGLFDWTDIDDLDDLKQFIKPDNENNFYEGNVYLDKVKDSYIYAPNKYTAIIGLENITLVDTQDALLVCHSDKIDNIGLIIDHLRLNDKKHLL
ncbi:MAG: mannose-1-phosphate guanylyltransferase [Melioribacteraceae bacterium]|nr:MAG: mannose-1-phosphate guanylyltransferase [Melioribacteraceae bacterium]